MKKTEKKNVKIWGENINLVQFLIGLFISIGILLVTLFIVGKLSGDSKDLKLIIGLIAVLVAFFINLFWIKPKRKIVVKEDNNDDN
ncbi:MAG TPA: hypothetical protein VJ845_02265 [Haploplasma sp.]|nr:hypothetical protein [Haploplasma sp.]